MFFKKKPKVKEQVNVGKAIATVNMREGMSRTITRKGRIIESGMGDFICSGESMIQNYLDTDNTLLCDDNGKYFPVSNIRDIEIKIEELFVDSND